MTAGGDTGEIEDEATLDEADDVADETDDVNLNENDRDPTAGASDIGGRAGEPDPLADIDDGDLRGDDQHEVGGGQTGMGTGPTGS
ncbi:MAG TPA: hypothetical protein VN224_14325 [Xanthomonadales bacterium]|nr:hypothetical protein [Xanthomonadales bacterium]